MSLNWSIEDVKDYKKGCWLDDPENPGWENRILNPITDGLILHTMAVGIGEITEDTVEEFYNRSRLYTQFFGGSIRSYNEETEKYESRPFTATEINDHIGLSTNVSYETGNEWRNRIWKYEIGKFNFKRALERETEDAKAKNTA
jgi:hypothetical protein